MAARDLARTLGATDALVFVRDHELGVPLPALGFPQTLPNIAGWRALIDEAGKSGSARGLVPMPGLGSVPAVAVSGECVLVLCGAENPPDRDSLLSFLSLLAAVLGPERAGVAVQGELAVARNSAREVQSLAAQLDLARRDLELRVHERTVDLQASNEALRGFTYHVSHDLRAPLRGIASTSRIVQEDFGEGLPQEAMELLDRQAEAATKLGRLIDDLLRLSRLSSNELAKRPLDLSAIARETAKEALSIHPDSAVGVVVEEGLSAKADPSLLRLAVGNLIENAVKYSPSGGTVRVGRREDGAYYVSDEGIGIDPRYFGKIFEPFQRLHLDSEFEGTGIGLSNVKQVMERHGGRAWVESEPGRGSTFLFTLA